MRFSMLMMTTFMVGLCMFASGLACLFKGLNMYEYHKGNFQNLKNAKLIMSVGTVLIVFGPVIMGLAAIYYMMSAKQLRDATQLS